MMITINFKESNIVSNNNNTKNNNYLNSIYYKNIVNNKNNNNNNTSECENGGIKSIKNKFYVNNNIFN